MKNFPPFSSLLAIVFLMFTAACSAPASVASMSVPKTMNLVSNPALKHAVFVNNVSGGSETNPMWVSKVDNNSFRAALEWSLASLEYKASSLQSAQYIIDAELIELDQPMIGISLEVKSMVKYKVTKGNDKKEYPIRAVGSAEFSDAFLANERLKIANERAMQENIKLFLIELAKVQ